MSKIWYKIKLLFKNREVTVLDGSSVAAIAEMQKKIDAYEDYIFAMHVLLKHKDYKVCCLLHDVPLAEIMDKTWKDIEELVKKEKQDNEDTD